MYHAGNKLINPAMIFEEAGLHSKMHIADFGCGKTGQIVFPASRIIGDDGMIYAVDILQDDLENVDKRAKMNGQSNIHTVWSDVELVGKTSIPEKSLDMVFMLNILHHVENINNVLDEAKRLLKPKARIVVVDWKPGSKLSIGPAQDKVLDFNKVADWAKQNNFTVQEKFTAGKYHTGMILFRHD